MPLHHFRETIWHYGLCRVCAKHLAEWTIRLSICCIISRHVSSQFYISEMNKAIKWKLYLEWEIFIIPSPSTRQVELELGLQQGSDSFEIWGPSVLDGQYSSTHHLKCPNSKNQILRSLRWNPLAAVWKLRFIQPSGPQAQKQRQLLVDWICVAMWVHCVRWTVCAECAELSAFANCAGCFMCVCVTPLMHTSSFHCTCFQVLHHLRDALFNGNNGLTGSILLSVSQQFASKSRISLLVVVCIVVPHLFICSSGCTPSIEYWKKNHLYQQLTRYLRDSNVSFWVPGKVSAGWSRLLLLLLENSSMSTLRKEHRTNSSRPLTLCRMLHACPARDFLLLPAVKLIILPVAHLQVLH